MVNKHRDLNKLFGIDNVAPTPTPKKYGWAQKSSSPNITTYNHPDLKNHRLHMSSSGGWSHYKGTAKNPSMLMGIGSGDKNLASHLRQFHHGLKLQEGNLQEDYKAANMASTFNIPSMHKANWYGKDIKSHAEWSVYAKHLTREGFKRSRDTGPGERKYLHKDGSGVSISKERISLIHPLKESKEDLNELSKESWKDGDPEHHNVLKKHGWSKSTTYPESTRWTHPKHRLHEVMLHNSGSWQHFRNPDPNSKVIGLSSNKQYADPNNLMKKGKNSQDLDIHLKRFHSPLGEAKDDKFKERLKKIKDAKPNTRPEKEPVTLGSPSDRGPTLVPKIKKGRLGESTPATNAAGADTGGSIAGIDTNPPGITYGQRKKKKTLKDILFGKRKPPLNR